MEIKVDTEKTVEQIANQMWEIVGRLATRCAFDIVTGTAFDAESILRDPVVQKDFLRYDKLITLIESVKTLDDETAKRKAALFKIQKEINSAKLYERLIDHVVKAENTGELLAAFHGYVPVLVHRMRIENIIKEGGENG